jgi:O-antigen ligase
MKAITYIREIGLIYLLPFAVYLIDPYDKGFLFGYVLTLALLLNGKKLISLLDRDFIFVCLFGMVYALFYVFNMESGVQFIFIYAFFPGIFYLFGKYLVLSEINTSHLVFLFFGIGFLFSISALISVLINLTEGGFAQIEREIPMFWSGKGVKATQMAAYLTFNMCLPIIYLIKQRKISIILQLLTGVIFIGSLLCVFRLGSRTQLVICLLSIIISLLFVVPRQTIKANTKLFFFLLLIVALVLKFVPLNLDADYFSVLGSRLQENNNTSSAGGRTTLWAKALVNLFKYPLGWLHTDSRYAHNMWLDTARSAGIIPLILLIIFTIRSLWNTFKAVRKTPNELLLNTTILIFTMSSMLIFFVEPIMEGLFFLFTVFCLFQGMINAYLKRPITL